MGVRVMCPAFSYRRSVRLPGYNYASIGAYFVTICAADRRCLFGEMEDIAVKVTLCGHVVEESWRWLAQKYPFVHLDEWVLMPNHLHAIIWLAEGCSKPLGSLVGAFKTVSSRRIKAQEGSRTQIWQQNYYEHIIRSDKALLALRQYIRDNPVQWAQDAENPKLPIVYGARPGVSSLDWAALEPPLR